MFLYYQIIGILVSIIAMIFITRRFYNDTLSTGMYISWFIIWILVILVSIFPQSTSLLANEVGLGRGLDLVVIFAIIVMFYFFFKLYNKIENEKKRINQLVSELAILQEEEKENNNN